MSARIKVALVVNNLERGGAQSLLLELMDRLDRTRIEPVLVYLRKPNDHTELLAARGHETIYCRVSPSLPMNELRDLSKLFSERKFQVIHAHTDYAAFVCRLAGLLTNPVHHIAHYHNVYERKFNPAYRRLEHALGPVTDQYIACSHAVEAFMRDRVELGTFPLKTILNGITLGPFREAATKRNEARKLFGITDDVFHIVHVARMKPVKRPERIVRALALVQAHHSDLNWRLTFVGDGEERGNVESIAAGNDRIAFVGNRDDVPMWLGSADLSVLLSDAEGLPISIIEAMAAGVPSLVSNIPAMTAVIHHGINGIVADHTNPEAIAQALVVLMRDPEKRLALARRASEYAAKYSVENFVKETEAMYESIIARPPQVASLGPVRRQFLVRRARRLALESMNEYKKQKQQAAP